MSALCRVCAAECELGLASALPIARCERTLHRALRLGLYSLSGGTEPTAAARALLRFKYQGDRSAGRALAEVVEQLARKLDGHFDAVVPIPLHPRRLRERGFNQSAWFARAACRSMQARLLPDSMRRRKSRRPQAELGAAERRKEVRGVFRGKRDGVRGMSVLLVDDVITTGSTVLEAARTLAAEGAVRVEALALLATARSRGGHE